MTALELKRIELQGKIRQLKILSQSIQHLPLTPTKDAPQKEKIALFRSLFRGREDVFPKRFESKKTGKSGYQPVCRNEWIRPVCQKPKIKCGECENRNFVSLSAEVIRNHLTGFDTIDKYAREYLIGVYPMLLDETCWFLAVDFDKETWVADAKAYLETCRSFKVPAALERSRSGNGGHIWIFFSEPIPAKLARQLGAFMLTQAMEGRPQMGFDSYDRFFPSQDTLPRGSFGNLIALPLQKKPRDEGNSVFIDDDFNPHSDQWAFLFSIQRMSLEEVHAIVDMASQRGGVLGVRYVGTDEDEIAPWLISPSGRKPQIPIVGPLPQQLELVLSNQIYIAKDSLPPVLRNRLIRLAAFQNPEFYRAQAMRFPTFDKPRIIHCCEDFPRHVALPRGCLDDVIGLLNSLQIEFKILDERFEGTPIRANFRGELRPEQKSAADAMLQHDIGVLSASTAFGKTVVAAFLIASRAVNTLVLVHRKELLDQWIERLGQFLDIPRKSIGRIGGGKREPYGMIDVGMIQTINRKGSVDDSIANYGHIVVDECHHISARSFEIVARQSKAKYVSGLSATVIRKDGHHPIIFMNCGPIRYKVDDKTQAARRPFTHRVITRATNFRLPHSFEVDRYTAIQEIYGFLEESSNRNELIVSDVIGTVNDGRFPLILSERKNHLQKLADMLSGKIENVIVMKGGMGKKQRKNIQQILDGLSENGSSVIIATGKYLGEGFDNPRLDALFLTLPISWRGTIAQYAGRLHRINDRKKEVLIYDYADLYVPVLARMYGRRIKGYHSIGYEVAEAQP
ncbi:MAG: DEAD/DEAH box helicase [Geobacteraceae bacterium]|nr:MAG: DEAD/DEAH box helicase [Geobacteraceae bacterium]